MLVPPPQVSGCRLDRHRPVSPSPPHGNHMSYRCQVPAEAPATAAPATTMPDVDLRPRLDRARRAVEEIAAGALGAATHSSTGGTVVGPLGLAPAGAGGGEENAPPNVGSGGGGDKPIQGEGGEEDERRRRRAEEAERERSARAFQLGMTLFGDDVSSIEREVLRRLGEVEGELRAVAGAAATSSAASAGAAEEGPDDPDAMEAEARALAAKAAFLRRCSVARAKLDEEEGLALSRPSSAPDGAGVGAGPGAGGPLVAAAGLLAAAEEALAEAEGGLEAAEGRQRAGDAAAADLEAAGRIASSLRAELQRRRSGLRRRCAAAVDGSVRIGPEGMAAGPDAAKLSEAGAAGGAKPLGGSSASSSPPGRDSLGDAYGALALLPGRGLDDALRALGRNLTGLVLGSFLDAHVASAGAGSVPPRLLLHKSERRGASAAAAVVHELRWSRPAGAAGGALGPIQAVEAWNHLLDVIRLVLTFVRERILLGQDDLCRLLGRDLFGEDPTPPSSSSSDRNSMLRPPAISSAPGAAPLLDTMVRAMWDTCLPGSDSLDVLADLPAMAELVREGVSAFESDLIAMGFFPTGASAIGKVGGGGGGSASPLSAFSGAFEKRFGEKRRAAILSRGRNILLKGDYHNTTVVGVDVGPMPSPADSPLDFDETDDGMSVFALHKCSVSQVASDLMDLCRSTMDAAVDPRSCAPSASEALLPPQFYRTARGLLDLYRAIVPSVHGGEIETVPRTAAVLHNDCVFFAHECLTLGLEYKERFSADTTCANVPRLRQLCTFVDLVPPFRELAARTMGEMINRQRFQLEEVVGSRISILRDALRSNEPVVEWTDAETGIAAGAYHLRHLSQTWRPILSRDIYGRTMGNLVDALYSMYLDQIMAATDISEAAGHFTGALFRNATRSLLELFAEDGSGPAPADTTAADRTARAYSLHWDKFVAAGEFMDMSLADITLGLGEGRFRSMTGSELSKLILAAFADSQKREALLRLLAPSEGVV